MTVLDAPRESYALRVYSIQNPVHPVWDSRLYVHPDAFSVKVHLAANGEIYNYEELLDNCNVSYKVSAFPS